jgi:tetratricopeptide (TPR) repeat protein
VILCNSPENKEIVTEYWEQYSRFSLKFKAHQTAEYYLRQKLQSTLKSEQEQGWTEESVKDRLTLASLYVQQGQYRQAKQLIEEVIVNYDWKNVEANLLFGLMYEKLGEVGLQRKHFAIAKVKRMRDLHLLPPKSTIPKNLRT